MLMIRSSVPLEWGALDLPVQGIARDWHGAAVVPPAMFTLAADPSRLWFVAAHSRPARLHPEARPGAFLDGLWTCDVAECFLANRRDGRYLEINLAPNGAWWACGFSGPRVRAAGAGEPLAGVETHADLAFDGSWLAALSIPLETLRGGIGFDETSTGNVAFILGTPRQRFLTAADLGGGDPDFHQPARFPALRWIDRGAIEAG